MGVQKSLQLIKFPFDTWNNVIKIVYLSMTEWIPDVFSSSCWWSQHVWHHISIQEGRNQWVCLYYIQHIYISINKQYYKTLLKFLLQSMHFFKLRSVFVKYNIEIFIINKPCEELKFDKFTNKKNYWNYHIIIILLS